MPLNRAEDIVSAFIAAWHERSGAGIAGLFAEDGDFVNVTGLWWHGRKAIAAPHDYALRSFFSQSTLRAGRTQTRALGPDHMQIRARLTLTGQRDRFSDPARERQTIITFLMERGPGGWIALSAQNTEVQPQAETFIHTNDGLRPEDYRN